MELSSSRMNISGSGIDISGRTLHFLLDAAQTCSREDSDVRISVGMLVEPWSFRGARREDMRKRGRESQSGRREEGRGEKTVSRGGVRGDATYSGSGAAEIVHLQNWRQTAFTLVARLLLLVLSDEQRQGQSLPSTSHICERYEGILHITAIELCRGMEKAGLCIARESGESRFVRGGFGKLDLVG